MISFKIWGKTAWEQFVKAVEHDLETFRDNLMILSHLSGP